jgi:asparagine synthase (glutamine-hydrolysing)
VRKLEPGSWLRVRAGDDPAACAPRAFWSAREVAERCARAPFAGSLDEAADALEARLRDAVRARMVADVPLGALLSGGVDSSLVVALMQAQGGAPVRTFSIGFEEASHDEAPFARAVARHLGTCHRELTLTAADALADVPKLASLYDEPFADASQIPTAAVARLAREHVTVALSGDGGDELFAGYRRYRSVLAAWRGLRPAPLAVRRAAAAALSAAARAGARAPGRARGWPGALARAAWRLPAEGPVELFARTNARCASAGELVVGARDVPTLWTEPARWPAVEDPLRVMMFLDFAVTIPDGIQVKVDRASMGVGLEVRCPLLDHRLLELAWSLPRALQIDAQGGKRALRRVLARYVPPALSERPKRGFGVPVAAWLRGPLRDWAEALLDERRLREQGILHAAPVRRLWREHLSRRFNHEKLLWHLLQFQAWREARRAGASVRAE